MEEQIREFIIETFVVNGGGVELDTNTPLVDSGVVDSMGVVEVVEFLEDEFGIEVDDDEVVPENVNSLGGLVRFVQGKQEQLAGTEVGAV